MFTDDDLWVETLFEIEQSNSWCRLWQVGSRECRTGDSCSSSRLQVEPKLRKCECPRMTTKHTHREVLEQDITVQIYWQYNHSIWHTTVPSIRTAHYRQTHIELQRENLRALRATCDDDNVANETKWREEKIIKNKNVEIAGDRQAGRRVAVRADRVVVSTVNLFAFFSSRF